MKKFHPILYSLLLAFLFGACSEDNLGEEGGALPDPTDLTAREETGGIRISWAAVPGADGYALSSGTDGEHFTDLSTTGSTTYFDRTNDLLNDAPIRIYYRVQSLRNTSSGTVRSAGAAMVSCLYVGEGDDGSTAPAAPWGLSAQLSDESVRLTWNDVPDADGYRVYRSDRAGSGYTLLCSATGTTATDTAPLEGDNYYRVTSRRGSVESEPCASVHVEYSAPDEAEEPDTDGTLTAPTNVRAVQQGNAIAVSWSAVEGASRYQVWNRRPAPYDIESFENVDAPATSIEFEWTRMVDGAYTFWVVAVDADYNRSEASARVTCNFRSSGSGGSGGETTRKLATPTGLEAYGNPTDRFVQISFEVVPLAYRYELYRSRSATGSYSRITASGGESGDRYILTDQNPLKGTSYYKVKAVALDYLEIEDSDLSDWVSITR